MQVKVKSGGSLKANELKEGTAYILTIIIYNDDTDGTTVRTVKKKIAFMRKTMFNLK